MKKRILCILLSAALITIGGCGSSAPDDDGKTNIIIEKDKSVIQRIREDFSESYYDADELKSMILDEAASYNNKHVTGAVSVNKISVGENMVTNVEMVYQTCDDYSSFNEEELFVGTGSQAQESGHELKAILTSRENPSETIAKAELISVEDDTLLIYSGTYEIYIPREVKYASDNALVSEDGKSVRLKEGQSGPFYIIY